VRPDVDHEVDASDVPVLLAFVDAESELGAAFLERFAGEIACIPATRVAAWRAALGGEAIDPASVERWVRRELPPGRRATRVDPRVRRVLTHLKSHPGEPQELALPRLAAVAGLSPSRFMHLFTESVGVPLRPYVLWLRLQRAAGELMRGASVTQAAHEAGFADAAHLTRTFRRMLGTKPSEMARRRAVSRGVAVESS
jgi:AraC-like DNA-binding protein